MSDNGIGIFVFIFMFLGTGQTSISELFSKTGLKNLVLKRRFYVNSPWVGIDPDAMAFHSKAGGFELDKLGG
jgi:hypothetical protein